MAGLYIHIPFCRQKCVYCDFMSGTNIAHADRYIDALVSEMGLYTDFFASDPVRTIYVGGGTPSMFSVDQLRRMISAAHTAWDCSCVEELTVECNPEDITSEWLWGVRALGVNRLSIGVQSLEDDELRWIGRRHDARKALEVVCLAQKAGFENISVDIMFALPCQTLDSLRLTLKEVVDMNVQHVSAYSLMYEEGSKLERMLRIDRVRPVDNDTAAEMYAMVNETLRLAGFEQYEISNYARPGFFSQHNSSYWHYHRYLGLGASACSFDGELRWSNVPHTLKYISSIEHGLSVRTIETLTCEEHYNEYVFTALRTCRGIDVEDLETRFGTGLRLRTEQIAERYVRQNLMMCDGRHLSLTSGGIYISDSIMSDFMIV